MCNLQMCKGLHAQPELLMKNIQQNLKSDERVLGDSGFVERVLKAADESLERKYQLKSQGYDIDKLADRVPKITGNRDNRLTKSPASVEHRVLAADELNFIWRGTQRQGCKDRQTSE